MKTGWNAYARWEPQYGGHSLVLIKEGLEGRSMVTMFEMEKLGRHGELRKDSLQAIPHEEVEDFMRAIMDAAWEVGIRPTGLSDHTNELTAVRCHLEDMRLLAKVRKPE